MQVGIKNQLFKKLKQGRIKMESSEAQETTTVTANSTDELQKLVNDMIENGWQTEGGVINNSDSTFSQKLVR